MSTFDILCVTNRHICKGDFPSRIEQIAKLPLKGIILREKDLDELEYYKLAEHVLDICKKHDAKCILHTYTDVARKLSADAIHLPLSLLKSLNPSELYAFKEVGASCHSTDDALTAHRLGASYITAGHIFTTECKKGVPPRGIAFLNDISAQSPLPVYAIGGINADNISESVTAGANGAAIMSGFMCCPDPESYFNKLKMNIL